MAAAHSAPTSPAPGASDRARIRLRPTRLGTKALLFHALLTATFFAIPYSNLFFLGIAFLSVIAIANVAWAHGNLRAAHASVPDLPPSPSGAPIVVRFVVRGSARAAHMLAARMRVEGAECRTAIGDVRGADAVALLELPPLRRGVYAVRQACLESTYPHGLVRATRAVAAPVEVVVYPAPMPLPADRRDRGALVAQLAGVSAAGAQGVAGLRDWRVGDEARSVHWRASARRGQFVVREPDDDSAEGLEMVLDRRCSPEVLEHALVAVATFAQVLAERKERLIVHTQGGSTTYGAGATPLPELWRALALAQPLPADAAAPPPAPTTALRLPRAQSAPAGRWR